MIWTKFHPLDAIRRATRGHRSIGTFTPLYARPNLLDGGTSIPLLASRLFEYGRNVLQGLFTRATRVTRVTRIKITQRPFGRPEVLPVLPVIGRGTSAAVGHKNSVTHRLVRWCSASKAADLRRRSAKKLLCGGKHVVPLVGLVGINLVSGHGVISKADEMERLCEDIRRCLQIDKEDDTGTEVSSDVSLTDLEIGEKIAKGCNAVVHAGRWKDEKQDEPKNVVTGEDANGESSIEFRKFDLAVKMMFNYDVESNAFAIMRAMHRETLPARMLKGIENLLGYTPQHFLSPHPNVVAMHCAFADFTPYLPDAMTSYPDALPARLNVHGSGRNMTMFLVMKRYHCNLRDYVKHFKPSETTKLLLLTQLMEAVLHMNRNGVAHRDLKSDNILLDLSGGLDSPVLAVSDFGNCLVSKNLLLPFTTYDIERGGNSALMAPEIIMATPGTFSIIDYRRSDLWTVGTLCYEIFGQENPFYSSTMQKRLDSRNYLEEELPPLDAPLPVRNLVSQILRRDPKQRPSAAVASNVCHLALWGPSELIKTSAKLRKENVMDWLMLETAISFVKNTSNASNAITVLRNTFLSRLRFNEIEAAFSYFTLGQ